MLDACCMGISLYGEPSADVDNPGLCCILPPVAFLLPLGTPPESLCMPAFSSCKELIDFF